MALVEPSVMANSIMASIYDVLTNGDETVPKSEDNFFSWATPGFPIGPRDLEFLSRGLTGVVRRRKDQAALSPDELEALRAQDTAGLYMQAENLARLLDFAVDVTKNTNDSFARLSVMNNEGSLSERYEYILRMSRVMQTVLDDDTKRKIELARAALVQTIKQKDWTGAETEVTGPSPLVVAYNEKMAAYENAALEYNCRRIEALTASNAQAVHYWATNASILRNRVRAAMADWQTTGYKSDYESIAAFIRQVTARDMSLLKEQYQDDLEKARLTGLASGSDFYYTSLAPAKFASSPGWAEFSFDATHFARSSSSSYELTGSTTKAGLFCGVVGAVGSHGNTARNSLSGVKFDSDHFGLSFQVAQAMVVRPWLKTAFLTSKLWRFDPENPEAKGERVSDGGSPPRGLIPAFPTAIVCIRNLKLKLAKTSGLQKLEQALESSSSEGGAVVSFGALHLAGSHGRTGVQGSGSANAQYDSKTQTLEVPGTQLIGFKCHVLPKSPDPDPSIRNWV